MLGRVDPLARSRPGDRLARDLGAVDADGEPGADAAVRARLAEAAIHLRSALAQTVRRAAGLAATAETLSSAYRSGSPAEERAGHVHDPRTAAAYAAARMPATFAAIGRALAATAASLPGHSPRRLLDVGTGTGSAAWAAVAVWPSLDSLTLVDREPAAIALGTRLAAGAGGALGTAAWRTEPIASADLDASDVVTAAYVLGELDESGRRAAIERMWAATRGVLVLVEPGSRAGYERIIAARSSLIAAGGTVVAPCPGDEPCPLHEPEWCHFLARLDRSPLQRRTKGATLSWEDEPYAFVAAARPGAVGTIERAPRVVLGRPRHGAGRVELRVCMADGTIARETISRRDGPAYRASRDLAWGDRVPAVVAHRLSGARKGDE
jgi:ribosomal protein RSM22 (predicted rRNA methylase)